VWCADDCWCFGGLCSVLCGWWVGRIVCVSLECCAFMLGVAWFTVYFGVGLCVCCVIVRFWCVLCGGLGCDVWFSGLMCVHMV